MGNLRTQIEKRAFQEQLQEEQKQQREKEDREQHSRYVREMNSQGLTPLSFEEWKTFLPEDQQDASLRAAIATARSNWRSLVQMTASQVASKPLSDAELAELGFELEERPQTGAELNVWSIRAALQTFMEQEARYDKPSHFGKLRDFLIRNSLEPTAKNFSLAFNLLWNFRLIEPKPDPEPEPPTPKVNLEIEPDPELERQRRFRDYDEKQVIRYAGRGYTQRQLDEMDSETYAKVTRLRRFSGWLPPARNI